MYTVESPVPQYFDTDGSPLNGGYIYFGTANQNPETSPVAVYWDAAGTQPAAQPLRTANGYIMRGGAPANVYAVGDYSVSVKNPAGVLVLYVAASVSYANTQAIIAAAGAARTPLIGGTGINSTLELRSTSGAGTTLPATTTDSIRGTRGNNGSQELFRFTAGGSLGIGDWTDGQAVNQHAGDDGTTTRVCSVRAATAPLFLGVTDRDNTESGGFTGRSMLSVEGIRLANTAGSKSMGAFRIISEGSSTTQIGGRLAMLTRRDGFTDADYAERFAVSNDGNILHSGGPGAVASPNRGSYAYGNTVLTVSGQTGRAVVELTTAVADADQAILGDIVGIGNYQITNKSVGLLQYVLAGATATDRGGELRCYFKADAGILAERVRFTAYGLRTEGPVGTLQAAPTLAIAANVIAPTKAISFLGAGLVKTITAPPHFIGSGGSLTIIPTAAFTTDTTGNIALASTAVIGRALVMTYDHGTTKFYPSY